jgi:ketosteroid isomerase-like protein
VGTAGELWNQFQTIRGQQDYDGLASLFAVDAVFVEPGGRHEGREAIRAWFKGWGPALSDLRIEPSLVIEEGDTVVAEWTGHGTHTGPLTMNDGSVIPATGNRLATPTVTILEIVDEQIVSAREYYDQLVLSIQLGLMPGG